MIHTFKQRIAQAKAMARGDVLSSSLRYLWILQNSETGKKGETW